MTGNLRRFRVVPGTGDIIAFCIKESAESDPVDVDLEISILKVQYYYNIAQDIIIAPTTSTDIDQTILDSNLEPRELPRWLPKAAQVPEV